MRDGDLQAGGFVAGRGGKAIEGSAARDFDRVVPHIGRALRLRNEIGQHRGIAASLQSALDGLAVGTAVVDADMRVLFANSTAETILSANDGLTSAQGRLVVAKSVREAVRMVLRVSYGSKRAPPPAAITAPRPSGRTPYILRVFPAIGTGHLRGAVSACATVTIHDPAAPASLPDPVQLRNAFGFTPAEAAVASLVPLAESKRLMADRLGVTENTVKAHLTAIRAKVGARSVTELAQILAGGTMFKDHSSS